MSAGVGRVVKLYMDTRNPLEPGIYLQTPTRRTYLIDSARRQMRGKHVGRWHLTCIVVNPEHLEPGATIFPLHWYRR